MDNITGNEHNNTLLNSLSQLKLKELNTEDEFVNYYVHTSDARNEGEQDRTIKTAISIKTSSEPCHILYSGHIGCGKSTELYRLSRILTEGNYLVCIGNCFDNLDMKTVKYTDLILFILETLLKYAKDNNINISKKSLENIETYWNTVHTIIGSKVTGAETEINGSVDTRTPRLLARVFSINVSVRSLLRNDSEMRDEYRRVIEPQFSKFIDMANDVIDDICKSCIKKGYNNTLPVILLDQLEKADPDAASELFEKHSQDLVRLRLHLVIPFPIEMCYKTNYSLIKNYYDYAWILPMIKLRNWDEETLEYSPFPAGKEVLRSIIYRRIDKELFADGLLDVMIEKTGGFLRHLLEVVYEAALNAVARDGDFINKNDMTIALDNLQTGISRMFPDSGRSRLERIANGEKRYSSDDELMEFLRCGAVFEYNGKRWVDLHPLIFDWLNDTRAAKKEGSIINHDDQ